MWKKILIAVPLCLLVVAGVLFFGWNPFTEQDKVKIHVAEAMTGRQIAEMLQSRGVIYNALVFRAALYVTDAVDSLQEGDYQLHKGMSVYGAIDALKHGRLETFKIVVPEGFNVRQIAKRLAEKGIVNEQEFLQAAKNFKPKGDFGGRQPVDFGAEGYLFPDTYEFTANTPPEKVLAVMHAELVKRLTPEIRAKIAAEKLSVHDFITLASLVEKEAKFPKDRLLIAAVFKKRLAEGMPLQSCASVQYILGQVKPLLSVADTQIPSPYNTYLNKGLPPGPIAAPGQAAIDAVLHSPPTEYLFFVADRDGRHHFAKTYEEHEQNIAKVYGNGPH